MPSEDNAQCQSKEHHRACKHLLLIDVKQHQTPGKDSAALSSDGRATVTLEGVDVDSQTSRW
jgi:hypothetical protein